MPFDVAQFMRDNPQFKPISTTKRAEMDKKRLAYKRDFFALSHWAKPARKPNVVSHWIGGLKAKLDGFLWTSDFKNRTKALPIEKAAARVVDNSFNDELPIDDTIKEATDIQAENAKKPNESCTVIKRNRKGQVIASTYIRPHLFYEIGQKVKEHSLPSLAKLVSFAVAPEHQGKGEGKTLLKEALRAARQKGYSYMYWSTTKQGEGFSRKLGLKPITAESKDLPA